MFQTVGPRCCAAIIPGGAAAPPYPLHRLSLGIGITPVRRSLFRCEAMASRKGRGRSRMQGRSKPTRMSLGQHKSEGRNPRAERSPKPEIRRTNRLTSRSAFRASGFGFCPQRVGEKLGAALQCPPPPRTNNSKTLEGPEK